VTSLPTDYIIQVFYTQCKRPVYKKHQGVYNGECPVCKEGASTGRKRRLFYFPQEHYFYCFNCSRSWGELNWIKEVTNKTYNEILKETTLYNSETNTNILDILENTEISSTEIKTPDILPEDSVNIFDQQQLQYFYNTESKENIKNINTCIEYCKQRNLLTAINRPKAFYYTSKDRVHKNRLIIPFYSESNTIQTYQTRALFQDQYPKYLTKYGEKILFGENTIDSSIPYIFIFEGPIDAMFVRNGVAMGGTSLTCRQQMFLNKCLGYEFIYVLDNDKNNIETNKVKNKIIKQNKKVFIWPKEFSNYKDVNEICVQLKLSEFPYKYIIKNSFLGIEAITKGCLHKN
jgi:DNA primase